jgi:nicotinamide mononucleotide (NMN) deamidase PncC
MRDRLDATWGLGETGAAGPAGNRYGDAAGHSWIAVAGPAPAATLVQTGADDRIANMHEFARQALELLAGSLTA